MMFGTRVLRWAVDGPFGGLQPKFSTSADVSGASAHARRVKIRPNEIKVKAFASCCPAWNALLLWQEV